MLELLCTCMSALCGLRGSGVRVKCYYYYVQSVECTSSDVMVIFIHALISKPCKAVYEAVILVLCGDVHNIQ